MVVLCLAPALLDCDCGEHGLQKGDPVIAVEPAQVEFKALNIGEEDQAVIRVDNLGTAPLRIERITLDTDDVFVLARWDDQDFDPAGFPDGIPQPGAGLGSSKELTVRFVPDREGDFSGEVVLASDAVNSESLAIPLHGVCSVPDIEVSPTMLDFGRIGLNSSASLSLTIENTGVSDLIIGEEDFSLASGDDQTPFRALGRAMVLSSGGSQVIEVIYSPKEVRVDPITHQAVPDEDVLLIGSNDPDENPVEVPLRGAVSANLPPFVGLKVSSLTRLDGTPAGDVCAIAPTDTMHLVAYVLDPEGDDAQIGTSNLRWTVESKPAGSFRDVLPAEKDAGTFPATFKADLSGEYVLCVSASDPQGNWSAVQPDAACTCQEANSKPDDDFSCPCIRFTALPREDIRIELTWENLGPDLDLHLVAPGGAYCSPTRDCRFDPLYPDNPDWDRFACVDSGTMTVCRTPNCDPAAAGCGPAEECFDNGEGPACWLQKCSGTDCYWDGRNPDWGTLGDEEDDPLLAIDCTRSCRAENINLNRPEPGTYTVMVNYYEYAGDTEASVRIYFKGDVEPTAEFTSSMTNPCQGCCDTWNVALIEWVDHEDHDVQYLQDAHTDSCCD